MASGEPPPVFHSLVPNRGLKRSSAIVVAEISSVLGHNLLQTTDEHVVVRLFPFHQEQVIIGLLLFDALSPEHLDVDVGLAGLGHNDRLVRRDKFLRVERGGIGAIGMWAVRCEAPKPSNNP